MQALLAMHTLRRFFGTFFQKFITSLKLSIPIFLQQLVILFYVGECVVELLQLTHQS